MEMLCTYQEIVGCMLTTEQHRAEVLDICFK